MDDECADAHKHENPLYGFRTKKDPLLVLGKMHFKVILYLSLRAPKESFKKQTPFDKKTLISYILWDHRYSYSVLEEKFWRNVMKSFFNIYPNNPSQFYSFLPVSGALLNLQGIFFPSQQFSWHSLQGWLIHSPNTAAFWFHS